MHLWKIIKILISSYSHCRLVMKKLINTYTQHSYSSSLSNYLICNFTLMTGPTTLLQYLFCQFWKQLKLSLLNQFWNKTSSNIFLKTRHQWEKLPWISDEFFNQILFELRFKRRLWNPPTLTKWFFRIVVNWRRDVLTFDENAKQSPDKRKRELLKI